MSQRWYWSNSAKKARVLGIDATAFYPFAILLFDFNWISFGIACSFTIFLIIIEFYRISPVAAFRIFSRSFRPDLKTGRYKKSFFRLNR